MEGLHAVPTRAESVARAGLVDENLGVRFTAAMTVGKLKLSSAAASVKPLLSDASPMVRAAAIYALHRNGQRVDQSPLASMLHNTDPRVRSQAAFVLGEIGNSSAIAMLKEAARTDPAADSAQSRLFKLQVAEALMKLGDSSAAASLDAALYPKLPEEFEAAVLGAQIIGEVKSERAIWQLVNIVETKAPRGADTGSSPGGEQFLYPKELRLAAATALAKMNQPDGVFVAEDLRNDQEAAIRSQSAFLYAATGKSASLPTLGEMMSVRSPMVRVSAAASVLRLTDPANSRTRQATANVSH
jgi:HEAT repeat protein